MYGRGGVVVVVVELHLLELHCVYTPVISDSSGTGLCFNSNQQTDTGDEVVQERRTMV